MSRDCWYDASACLPWSSGSRAGPPARPTRARRPCRPSTPAIRRPGSRRRGVGPTSEKTSSIGERAARSSAARAAPASPKQGRQGKDLDSIRMEASFRDGIGEPMRNRRRRARADPEKAGETRDRSPERPDPVQWISGRDPAARASAPGTSKRTRHHGEPDSEIRPGPSRSAASPSTWARPTPPSRAGSARTRSSSQLLACWLVVDPRDRPLSPRLIGPPGIGKTTLAMAAARLRKQALYINQCTADTRPEDLLVTPVLAESGKIAYHASPLGLGDAHRRRLRARRGEPDEREVVGEPRPAARPPPLRRERRRRHHHPRPPRLPLLRDDERGRVDLRGPRLHPLPAPADPRPSASPSATTRWRSSSTTSPSPRPSCWP